MNFSLDTLSQIYDEQIWLEISEADLQAAEPIPQKYSNQTGRSHAFLNRLCLNAVLKWIKQSLILEMEVKTEGNLEIIWEFVNGFALLLEDKKVIFLPSDALDTQDFAVPQEWVDIPNLAGDYYVPIQVDLEHRFLHIWGFISRKNLKQKADRDPIYRTYYVDRDDTLGNLEILWDACSLCTSEKGEITALETYSNARMEQLITQLSQPSPYSPRLAVKFEEWGALLNEDKYLQKLYEQRLEASQSKPLIDLSQWLNGIVDAGWHTVEELFNPKTLAPAFRSKEVRGMRLDNPERIEQAVQQLYTSQTQISFPKLSPSIAPNHTDASIQALVHLLRHTEDESIRWKAAEYLWAIAPNHAETAIRKVMDVGIQLMGHPIALMIGVLRKLNGKLAILVRVYPIGGKTKLPPGLQLVVMKQNGDPITGLQATARETPLDDYISLNFCADRGDRFNVGLILDNARAIEQFVV